MMLGNGWINPSPVDVLIQRACDPMQHEPNYAIHLELAEHINNKKSNTPRETAMGVVRMINHRNPHISILALSLLDSLVENCGYPFHLQIATKEFLNEMVRRFPERPPPFPGPIMTRILQTINGWKEGICVKSRWKEDLGNIRDMHRLLTFKGYRFRDLPRNNSTQNTNDIENLKTAEELETEDREAQQAKLQELIRRGSPRDLATAQELMKSLAGANPDAKPDYKSQAMKELQKLENKVVLLDEILDKVDVERNERYAAGDVHDQVAAPLIAARPKLQKWISDAEADDPESLAMFLQINDQINNVLNRLEAFKKGDYAAMANAIPTNLSGQLAPKSDLIDLMDDPTPAAQAFSSNPINDLAAVFGGASSASPSPFNGSQNGGSSAPGGLGSIMLPTTPQPQPQLQSQLLQSQAPFHQLTQGTSTRASSSQPPASSGSISQTQQPQSMSQSQSKDPFADLAGLF